MWHNVRLMNKLTAYLMLLACIFLLAAAVRSVMHLPYFALHTVVVEAAENNVLQHIKAAEVRANISGKLRGNFFTADLESVRQTFQLALGAFSECASQLARQSYRDTGRIHSMGCLGCTNRFSLS